MTATGAAGRRPQVAGQQVLSGMPAGLYPCTPSRLLTWQDCPRRYRFTYLDRPAPAKGPPWAHLSLGAAVHSALARWWVQDRSGRTPRRGADLLIGAWLRDGFRDDAQSAQYRDRAAHWVQEYLSGVDPDSEPVAVERTMAATTEHLVLSGRVDRVDLRRGQDGLERVVVVDYKVGRRVPTAADAASSLQLAVYAVAASRTMRRPVGAVELHHVPTGTVASVRHDDASLSRHLQRATDLGRQAAWADAVHARGEAADTAGRPVFAPSPSPGCAWCDVRRHCREGMLAAPQVDSWAGLP